MSAHTYIPLTDADFSTAFPGSRRVLVDGGQDVRVPMREIALSNGDTPVRVYDTGGPRNTDVHVGLPPLRSDWIQRREDVVEVRDGNRRPVLRAAPGRSVSQLHYARRGQVTPEMEFIAVREGLPAEFV